MDHLADHFPGLARRGGEENVSLLINRGALSQQVPDASQRVWHLEQRAALQVPHPFENDFRGRPKTHNQGMLAQAG